MLLAKRLALITAATILLSGSQAWPASAHASLVKSTPSAGQILDTSPLSVTLTFDDDLIEIDGQDVNQISVYKDVDTKVDLGDSSANGASVSVSLKSEIVGNFRVIYRVLSNDGHPVSGEFEYRVNPTFHSTKATHSAEITSAPAPSKVVKPYKSAEPVPDKTQVPTKTAAPAKVQVAVENPNLQATAKAVPAASSSAINFWPIVALFAVSLLGLVVWRAFSLKRSKEQHPEIF